MKYLDMKILASIFSYAENKDAECAVGYPD